MRQARTMLLLTSASLAVFVAGGLTLRAASDENPYGQVRLFSEVLSSVLDHYVDPVESRELLENAYEGMFSGLDAHGAFLGPDEVAEWKAFDAAAVAGPGVTVLRAGRSLQIVAVEPGSAAADADVEVGDQLRRIDGRAVRDLSIEQAWRLLRGESGSVVELDLLRPRDGFSRRSVELVRAAPRGRAFELRREGRLAVLDLDDLRRTEPSTLGDALRALPAGETDVLVVDLRNAADLDVRHAAPIAALLVPGAELRLRGRDGEMLETLGVPDGDPAWSGPIEVVTNGATAGSAEALTTLLRERREARVLGESTYGLGAEPSLFEVGDGAAVLLSASLWESADGGSWNGDGLEPDELLRGDGEDFESVAVDQLRQVLESIRSRHRPAAREAA